MFADRLKEKLSDAHLLDSLFEGTRMVSIHNDVVEAALGLLETADEEKMRQVSQYTCWPDYDTWLEFTLDGCDIGLYFHGEGKSVLSGHALFMIDYKDGEDIQFVPVVIDLQKYGMGFCDLQMWARIKAERMGIDQRTRELFDLLEPGPAGGGDPILQQIRMAPFVNEMKPLLLTILAFMNSPKLIRTRKADVERLNARRLKRGKYPYHPHHEVRLNIDKHDFKITQGQGDGPERCLHFVRAHLRFLVHSRYKNVSVVLVPPHYRGNPELGIMNTSYAVDRQNSKRKN